MFDIKLNFILRTITTFYINIKKKFLPQLGNQLGNVTYCYKTKV